MLVITLFKIFLNYINPIVSTTVLRVVTDSLLELIYILQQIIVRGNFIPKFRLISRIKIRGAMSRANRVITTPCHITQSGNR